MHNELHAFTHVFLSSSSSSPPPPFLVLPLPRLIIQPKGEIWISNDARGWERIIREQNTSRLLSVHLPFELNWIKANSLPFNQCIHRSNISLSRLAPKIKWIFSNLYVSCKLNIWSIFSTMYSIKCILPTTILSTGYWIVSGQNATRLCSIFVASKWAVWCTGGASVS